MLYEVITVSEDFYQVLEQCRKLHTLTSGAWDGTVKPLVDLWGFGTKARRGTPPEPEVVQTEIELDDDHAPPAPQAPVMTS